MTQAPVSTSGLVRVSVSSGTRRVDLVLPGSVPLAELVPELARSVGLLDAATVYGGYRVVTREGRELAPEAGLIPQGIEDGGLLTVTAGVDEAPPRIYDDVVEAMTDVVERDLQPWAPASGRRTALVAAGLLMTLGAVALLIQYTSLLAGVAAVVVAVALVAGAIVLSRAQHESEAAVVVAWMGCAYAALAGLMLVLRQDSDFFGLPVACAGGGALVAGLICVVGLGEGRTLALPPVVVGAIFLATGLLTRGGSFDPAVVLTTALAVVVLAGSVFPWLALGVTGTRVDQLFAPADITADPDEIDPVRVGADARVAHQILVATSATVGLLLVLVAPLSVSLGLSGTLLAVVSCLVVMLRTRQYRTGQEVLVGLGSGILGLVSIAVSLLWMHPDWRPTVAVTLAATGAVLLAVSLVPGTPSLRRGRLGDLAETVCLLALLPLVVLATGIYSAIRTDGLMATKKDLVEAYSFSRRRLITAFLSGAPGGREVEPSRPGRTVVGGLALAVLLVAGAAIASVLASRTPEDWNQVGLVVTRGDQPATYVILEEHDPPELIPVINITSAQLILGADVKATSVDQEVVDEQTPGLPIGILGAPQTLPRPKQFIETGWTACTDDGVGIAVDVSNDERVDRTTSAAIVVESAGGHWLIATSGSSEGKQQRAYRYPIAESEGDNLLVDYGLGQKVEAISVPPEWLGLFPEGGEIGPAGFDLPHLGRKADPSPVPGAEVGDYVVDGGRAAMVIDGGWQPLDPFALAVLENSSFKNGPNLLTEGELPASYAETTYLARTGRTRSWRR